MSEKRGFVCRNCRWKLLVAAIIGGFVGAVADDVGSLLLAKPTDPWVAKCETMLDDHGDPRGDRALSIDGEVCFAIVYPELADRTRIRNDFGLVNGALRTVRDTHKPALRAAGDGGEVLVRFRVDASGAALDPEIVESSGQAAVEALALELASTMSFSPVTDQDEYSPTWAEFPVAVGVRSLR